MYNRLYGNLTKNNLLFDKQFGFRKGHSTEYALIEFVNRIYDSFNKNKSTLGVFIDLSKAFDTVNHNILLEKLKLYGKENNNLKWFTSYLSRRKLCLEHKDIKKVIERAFSIKFLSILLDEHLSWKNHISVVEKRFKKILEFYIKPKIFSVRVV